jgi:hypothetical protein
MKDTAIPGMHIRPFPPFNPLWLPVLIVNVLSGALNSFVSPNTPPLFQPREEILPGFEAASDICHNERIRSFRGLDRLTRVSMKVACS